MFYIEHHGTGKSFEAQAARAPPAGRLPGRIMVTSFKESPPLSPF